jgi:hypothetical protein
MNLKNEIFDSIKIVILCIPSMHYLQIHSDLSDVAVSMAVIVPVCIIRELMRRGHLISEVDYEETD